VVTSVLLFVMLFPVSAIRAVVPIILLLSCSVVGAGPISRPVTKEIGDRPQKITVRIRNGKTGLPIWVASPYVFLGKTDPQNFEKSHRRTELWNDAHVDVTGVNPPEVRIWEDFINRDCRFGDKDRGDKFRTFDFGGNTLNGTDVYDLNIILKTGIVAQNNCSAKTQKPEPGVLTIYVIPLTLKELWNI